MRVWTSFRVENDPSLSNAVNQRLADAGIESVSYRPGIAGPGLVFFDRVSEELYGLLREVIRAEAEPVLAIGASHSAFNGENCWQLLNAGATDVFAWDHSEGRAPRSLPASSAGRVDELMRSRLV